MYKIIVLTLTGNEGFGGVGCLVGEGVKEFCELDIATKIPTIEIAIDKINKMAKENGWRLEKDYSIVGGHFVDRDNGDCYYVKPSTYENKVGNAYFNWNG